MAWETKKPKPARKQKKSSWKSKTKPKSQGWKN